MIKRLAFVLALACLLWACMHVVPNPIPIPGVIVVEAQTLPIAKTLSWNANPAGDNVTNYTVTEDGTVIGNPTVPSQSVTFTSLGTHTLTVTATNSFGTSAPATLTVVVQLPTTPAGLKLQ